MRRWVRVSSPWLALLAALGCVGGYLVIEWAMDGVGSPMATPLTIGVYVTPEGQRALAGLLDAHEAANAPTWQVQLQADQAGAGRAAVEFAFGPLRPNIFGSTAIWWSENDIPSGTLPTAVDIVFAFPSGTTYGADARLPMLRPNDPGDTCARWNSGGAEHDVTPVVRPGGGGWPDVMVCHLPAIANFTSLRIAAAGVAPAPSLRQSLVGTSAVSVSNPRALGVTMSQDDAVPKNLVGDLAQEYAVTLQPNKDATFTDVAPTPAQIGLQTRQFHVGPGGFVAAGMLDKERHDSFDALRQFLLLLGGVLLGLIPAALAWRKETRPAGDAESGAS